jgi:hypothetical protein
MTCQFAHDDGAYVLGALDPAERRVFEDHLPHCANCRSAVSSLAGLPGLLAHVPPALVENLDRPFGGESSTSTGTVVAIAPAPTPAPDTLLPRLMWAAKVERRKARRRTGFVAGGIAAAAVAIAFAGTVIATSGQDGTERPPVAEDSQSKPTPRNTLQKAMVSQVADLKIEATVALTQTTAGTKLVMVCDWTKVTTDDYPANVKSFSMVVKDKGGNDERVATFNVGPGDKVEIPGTTQTPIRDLSSVQVRQSDGTVLLKADL